MLLRRAGSEGTQRGGRATTTDDFDRVELEARLFHVSNGFESVGREFTELSTDWTLRGVDPAIISWLNSLMAKAEWWAGRTTAVSEVLHEPGPDR